jgi:YD repeat-containing protein
MEVDLLPPRRRLERMSARALIGLGRLPCPLLRRAEEEFLQLSWDDAVKLVARRLADGGRVEVGDRAQSVEAAWVLSRLQAALPGTTEGGAVLTLGPVQADVLRDAPFRAHCLEFLDPVSVSAHSGETLLLPAQSRYSQAGGSTWRGPDDLVRFSPEIRGNPVPEARPDWTILVAVGRDLPPVAGFPACSGADELRALIAAAEPDLAGLAELTTPGTHLHFGQTVGQ